MLHLPLVSTFKVISSHLHSIATFVTECIERGLTGWKNHVLGPQAIDLDRWRDLEMTSFVDLLVNTAIDPILFAGWGIFVLARFQTLVECYKVLSEIVALFFIWIQVGLLLLSLSRCKFWIFTSGHLTGFALIETGQLYIKECLSCWIHRFRKWPKVALMNFGSISAAIMNIFVRCTSRIGVIRLDYKVPLIENIPILCAWHIIIWVIPVLVRSDAKVMLLHLIIVIMHTFQAFLFLLSILVWIGHKSSIKCRVHGRRLSHRVRVANVWVKERYDSRGWLIATGAPFLWLIVLNSLGHHTCIFGLLEVDRGWWRIKELLRVLWLRAVVGVSTNDR